MKKGLIIIGIIFIALTTYFVFKKPATPVINEYTNGKTTREVVEKLENDLDEQVVGAVWQDEIELTFNNESVKIYDEQDQFYVSIAPYIDNTHVWGIHSLVGCMGELQNEVFNVKLIDQDNVVVFDGEKSTYSNGFMGFWLDRDNTYTVSFEYQGKTGTYQFSTTDKGYTCITSFQLA